MSTPQLEDGFIRIANELFEAILSHGFSQRELLVLLTIVRKTYGYGKKEDDLSASQIGDLCALARPHVTSTLNALALRNVITKRPGRFGSMIGIQKNHTKWVSADQLKSTPDSTESVHPSTESVHVPNEYRGSTESVQVDSTDSVHTKDNLPKDNHQKKSSCAPAVGEQDETETGEDDAVAAGKPQRRTADQVQARFERFYEAYPRKRSRNDAVKAFTKLNPDDTLLEQILASLEQVKASGEWSDPKFIPYPASWLNAAGWLDEVQAAYSTDEVAVIDAFNHVLGAQLGDVSTSIFVPARAAAIREFVTFSQKPGFVEKFFPWVRDNAAIPPRAGFDWIISRKGFADISGGQHGKKAA
ncbi:replication protein [Massilia sp. YIM B02769]|uniref:replication protein n=1 Tax=Massilia sp. YIM B02769 TaxID=3050129 RepID=UPI0025B694E4|nr:replication protein [Massilia sp. YIM B02769]MDN4061464.1 replication protein [Massilia sp. YIM B02769]